MRNYYRVMLGKGSVHAGECFAGGSPGRDLVVRTLVAEDRCSGWCLSHRPCHERANGLYTFSEPTQEQAVRPHEYRGRSASNLIAIYYLPISLK